LFCKSKKQVKTGDNMKKKPNILIITTDQQRFDTLGINNPMISTPNLDQLAFEGAYFENTYSPNPVCVPARQNMFTGLSSRYHGFDDNDFANVRSSPYYLPTFAQLLSDVGYDTLAIGKVHFQPNRRSDGFHRYFMMDEIPIYRDDDDYAIYLRDNGHPEITAVHGVRDPIYMMPQTSVVDKKYHGSTWVANKAIEQLKINNGHQPFLMWAGFIHPHPPLDILPEYSDMYKDKPLPDELQSVTPISWLAQENKNIVNYPNKQVLKRFKELYYAAISSVDEQIGRIIQTLKDIGEYDNTCIIFCSDHGEMLGDMGTFQKFLPYDGSSRVPMIVRFPQRFKEKQTIRGLASLNDIMPTLLDVAQIEYPAPYPLLGKSLFDLENRDLTFIEHGRHQRRWVCVRDHQFKFTHYYGGAHQELFDLENDPFETINCMELMTPRHWGAIQKLKPLLIEWENQHGLSDHIENGDFKFFPACTPRPFMGTGELVFPKRISQQQRNQLLPLRQQIVNCVKFESVVHLDEIDFSYMLETKQLTEADIEWITAEDKKNKSY